MEQKFRDSFETMSYGENLHETMHAEAWLESIQVVDKSPNVHELLHNVDGNKYVVAKKCLLKLASSLEKKRDLICQIEIVSRGVLCKDTNKAIDSMADYFNYHGNMMEGDITSNGMVVYGLFGDDHPLWLLGLFLAPLLVKGYKCVMIIGLKFATIATFIMELVTNAGLPDRAITLLPASNWSSLKCPCSLDLYSSSAFEDYRTWNYKTPTLVFDDADLDSTLESVIDSAWGYQGMQPWSVGTVLVQDNIFDKFCLKLKTKLALVRLGTGDDKLADISYPSNPLVSLRLVEKVEKAKTLGVEVFQREPVASHAFTPTLLIGSEVDTNKVFGFPQNDSILTILPFRHIDEAVSLANDGNQGLAASLWSENIGLVNEVARKLHVGNVWVNCQGLFCPNLPLTNIRWSLFGAKNSSEEKSTPHTEVSAVTNIITSGGKMSRNFVKIPYLKKINIFGQINDLIKEKYVDISKKLPKSWIQIFEGFLKTGCLMQNGYYVTSYSIPKGVIAIEICQNIDVINQLILAALFAGNIIILLNSVTELDNFYKDLSQILPQGVLTVMPYSEDVALTALTHGELNVYFYCVERQVNSGDFTWKTHCITERINIEDIFNYTRDIKNIWCNIGQSSQCDL